MSEPIPKTPKTPKTPWHLLLGQLLKYTLEPVGVEVQTEVPLLVEAPKADIVILHPKGSHWRENQRRWLADGLREAEASRLLIEFKYSESLNEDALAQLVAYDYFYRQAEKLSTTQVACFLVVAHSPRSEVLERLELQPTNRPGVYRSEDVLLKRFMVIVPNQLEPLPHNAPLKCFATRRREQQKAFQILRDNGYFMLSTLVGWFIVGLWRMFAMSTVPQVERVTPEVVMQIGKEWLDALLKAMPVEERMRGLPAEERMRGITLEERLAGIEVEQLRAYLERLGNTMN
ncbi:conserved hypothetical protein [Gammaproteobacteria bacterium]